MYQIIDDLAATDSRLEKEAILEKAWKSGHYDFFEGAKYCYNSWLTFGVKKVPKIIGSDDESSDYTFAEFKSLLDNLISRNITGNAARDALTEAAERCDPNLWNKFYRQIIIKDLRCGVTETTINKVLNKIAKTDPRATKYIIPIFQVQLAESAEPDTIFGRKMIDPKFDGIRITTILNKENNTITMFTRNGKINENFNHIVSGLEKVLEKIPGSIVLDGEMISNSFQELMKQVNRKVSVNTADAKYALFDIIPLTDFINDSCSASQEERHKVLCELEPMFSDYCIIDINNVQTQNVFVVPKLVVDLDTIDGRRAFNEFNLEALNNKLEGIMVKCPYSTYKRKRSNNWIKIKPVIEVSLTVEEVEEGTGRNEGRLGNLICRGFDLGHKIRVSVGSGFDDTQRIDFWNNREKLIGQIIEIRADALSHNQGDGDEWSLRFPRFIKFRSFDPGEKI